ncbi:substrate-binding domain-containing protein [Actinacidiphila glaucinigra]|uniref:substrate-binding domain-containing protein n=1 Tax=Actinacidiphila glaucinigra TaxID=235986 RepID=UPI00366BD2FD
MRGAVVSAAALLLVALGTALPARAAAGTPVAGAGSTWALNPMDQWRYAMAASGHGIVAYSGLGSAEGRKQFGYGILDYAVSELPYGLTEGGVTEKPPTRPFAYVPVVAGALGLHYNLRVDGEPVTDLRLSSATVAGIFTRTITRWDDPAIRADNPGTRLPATPVVPVVRADASGTTAALTQWLADRQPAVWGAYCAAAGRGAGCGTTSLFPTAPGDVAVAGSNGVTGYVSRPGSDGAITYAESSYAQSGHTVMARVLNHAGFYTSPTQGGVTAGLARAATDPSGFVRTGDAYTDPDPRTYPLPIVAHLIVPTATGTSFSTAKGRTLASLASLALCDQDTSTYLGNSPLPPNLVGDGLRTTARIPGAVPGDVPGDVDTSGCAAAAAAALRGAPQPRACDRVGVPACGSTAPGGHEQSIVTTVEPGALVISIEGSPHVVLPAPVPDPSGEHLHTSGPMTPVTVTDSRPGNVGWTASGQAGDFAGPAGAAIPASSLTWAPVVVDPGNVREVTAGPPVPAGDGDGLGRARTLATGSGPGTVNVGARLFLDAPTGTRPGTYTSVLTLTVI